jgi:ribosomal-protein-alanine N-acetyltransferase
LVRLRAVGLIPRKGIGITQPLVARTLDAGGSRKRESSSWMMPIAIEAGPCVLRQWRLTDEEALIRHANDRRVSINLRDRFPYPYTPADAAAWLARTVAVEPPTSFAIAERSSDEAVGGVSLMLQEDVERISVEIGYWLGVTRWGRGIATAAVRAATTYAFDVLGRERVFAFAFVRNPASARVLEKAGFRREGTLLRSAVKEGVVVDQFLYAVTKTEWAR